MWLVPIITAFVAMLFWANYSGWNSTDSPLKLPRFTIRDLLLSTALIAVGMGVILVTQRTPDRHVPFYSVLMFCCVPIGSSAICAGLFLPFGKARVGAILGLLVAVVFMCMLADAVTPARE